MWRISGGNWYCFVLCVTGTGNGGVRVNISVGFNFHWFRAETWNHPSHFSGRFPTCSVVGMMGWTSLHLWSSLLLRIIEIVFETCSQTLNLTLKNAEWDSHLGWDREESRLLNFFLKTLAQKICIINFWEVESNYSGVFKIITFSFEPHWGILINRWFPQNR